MHKIAKESGFTPEYIKDEAECLNVFIHADMKYRAERIVKEYGECPETPEQRLRDKDRRRASYHRFYTDMKWGQAMVFISEISGM